MPAYIVGALGIAVLAGSISERYLLIENAFMFVVAGLLIVAGLGFQAMRPLLTDPNLESAVTE